MRKPEKLDRGKKDHRTGNTFTLIWVFTFIQLTAFQDNEAAAVDIKKKYEVHA